MSPLEGMTQQPVAIAGRPPPRAAVPHLPQNDIPFSEDPHAIQKFDVLVSSGSRRGGANLLNRAGRCNLGTGLPLGC
jgi:hypothetical protein